MLQFQTCAAAEGRYSVAEQAQMALEGGCRWISLDLGEDADAAAVRDAVGQVAPMCAEAQAFLTLVDRPPEEVRELGAQGVHGVHLTAGGPAAGAQMREALGPEAVVSVQAASVSEADDAFRADLDFVTLAPGLASERCRDIIAALRRAGVEIPVVADGPRRATLQNLRDGSLAAAGWSGYRPSADIAHAPDPVERTRQWMESL